MDEPVNNGSSLTVAPVDSDRWANLETLFGSSGAYAGCWCQFWRCERAQFKAQKGEGNRTALHAQIADGGIPGLLAYDGEQAVGWCGLGPRETLIALEKSRILKRVDDLPVWSVVCFFIARTYRRRGVMSVLLNGAIDLARAQGAAALEGYPIDLASPQLAGQRLTSYSGYMGVASAYRAAGFVEVGRASATQLIMRHDLRKERSHAYP